MTRENRGDKGDAATVMVGTVTTAQPGEPATVENVGTVNNAVLNFRLPKGDDGQIDLLSTGTGDTNYHLPSVPGNAVIRGIYGKTEQVQTQGYQMLNVVPFQNANFNVKENGYIVNVKSLNTNTYQSFSFKLLSLSDYWKGKKITVAMDAATFNNKGQNRIGLQYAKGKNYVSDVVNGTIVNTTKSAYITATLPDVFPDGTDSIQVALFSAASIAGNTSSNCTYYGVRVYEGDYDPAKVWEPYSGGFPSPRVSERTRNLFDYTKISTKSQEGATVTNNNDGTFTISGSGELTEVLSVLISISHEETVRLFTAGTYKSIYGKTIPYALLAFANSSGWISELNHDSKVINITQSQLDDSSFHMYFGFYAPRGNTIVSGTVLPFIYKVDDSETEPPKPVPYYTGDWSQPLNDAGGDNGLKLLSESKNRLTNETRKATGTVTTTNGVTFTELPDGGILVNGTSTSYSTFFSINLNNWEEKTGHKMHREKKYKLYGCPFGGSEATYWLQVYGYANGELAVPDYGNGSEEFEFDTTTSFLQNVSIRIRNGVTVNNLIFRPMILEADIDATEYYPYAKTEANFSPLSGLKIEEESKLEYATYIDNSGQAWIADSVELIKAGGYYIDSNNSIVTVDKDTWVRWHRTMTAEFDGSDDEGWHTSVISTLMYRNGSGKYSDKILKHIDHSVIGAIVSDNYITVTANTMGTYGGKTGISIEGTSNKFYVYDPNYNTNDISLWKAHLSEKPLKCLFALDKPYAEPLAPPTEALSLMSYSDVTYISGDNEVNPEIEIDVPKRTEGAYLLGGYVSGVKAAAQAEAVNTALINIQSQML